MASAQNMSLSFFGQSSDDDLAWKGTANSHSSHLWIFALHFLVSLQPVRKRPVVEICLQTVEEGVRAWRKP